MRDRNLFPANGLKIPKRDPSLFANLRGGPLLEKTMANIVIQENGKIRDVANVELAEKIVEMRKKSDPWKVIDTMVKVWTQNTPDEVEAMRINIGQYRETLEDQEFGATRGGKDQERRFHLAFPKSLMLMIRTQYKAEELPMDKKFFREFLKRYPFFRVAAKD